MRHLIEGDRSISRRQANLFRSENVNDSSAHITYMVKCGRMCKKRGIRVRENEIIRKIEQNYTCQLDLIHFRMHSRSALQAASEILTKKCIHR
jgi:hypothetical protein